MTAGQAAQLGPDAFNAWIDAKINRQSKHRAQMSHTWLLHQPQIAAMLMLRRCVQHPTVINFVLAVLMTWKVETR
jgi:hypothetical protein